MVASGQQSKDGSEIQFEHVGKDRVSRRRIPKHALSPAIGLNQRNPFVRSSRRPEVIHRLRVDRKKSTGRAIFRSHVANRCSIGDGHVIESCPKEFDELSNHAVLSQHLSDG